ncbi:hypothetical protein E4U46_008003 [Claviceps purpurea]|nr:hypothetical protein E4U46_008003 [Claviceps purpurea]
MSFAAPNLEIIRLHRRRKVQQQRATPLALPTPALLALMIDLRYMKKGSRERMKKGSRER